MQAAQWRKCYSEEANLEESQRCVICGEEASWHFEHDVLGRHRARYFRCCFCNCMFAAEPYWLAEAYAEALNVFDTGVVARNLALARTLVPLLYFHIGPEQPYLDYAGGYGFFARHMRDLGFDYFWEDRYARNLVARGFESTPDMQYAAISAFEVLEHLPDPVSVFHELSGRAETLIFTTELWSGRPPLAGDWWYFGFEHGQHIVFYSQTTLAYLARRFEYELITDGRSFHVFTRRPDRGGIVDQIVRQGRVRRRDLVTRTRDGNALRLPPFFTSGPTVSLRHLDRAVRKAVPSRTLSDHERLRNRFREETHANRGD